MLMKPIKIVSFASRHPTEYAESAERLRLSADEFGHPNDVEIIDFGHSERKAITLHKPTFILEKLRQDPVPTIWLDVDTTLLAPLVHFPDGEWDVGFCPHHKRTLSSDIRHRIGLKSELRNAVSGFAVAFNPTPLAFHFLEVWKYLCDWPELVPQYDHYRMSIARKMVGIRQINIARALIGTTLIGKTGVCQSLPINPTHRFLPLD